MKQEKFDIRMEKDLMSIQLDEYAKEWLAKHAHEIPSEELIEENTENVGEWPVPQKVANLGVFADITSQKDFNRIISDVALWSEIKERSDLYEKWIIPNAIILFGKNWFDRVKWKNSIHRGIAFPLFSEEDKSYATENKVRLEDTTAGKAIIAKIIDKTSYALDVYLEGKWLIEGGSIKKPGGYIIDSIRNEFVRSIGTDLGYKLSSVLACPYCLSDKNISKKTPLIHNGSKQFTCPKCDDVSKSLEYVEQNNSEMLSKLKDIKKFKNFFGITCVCPSDECTGYFVPMNCIDFDSWAVDKESFKNKMQEIGAAIKNVSVSKNTQQFTNPPSEILCLQMLCPYCHTRFTIEHAFKSKSGFKGKSGMLTGLPSITIWEQKCSTTLDQAINEDSDLSQKDSIVGNFFDLEDQILAKQKVNILIDELIIQMSKINKAPISGFSTWCFYEATIEWMIKYWKDAAKYFFDWDIKERDMTTKEKELYPGEDKKKMTVIPRGQEVSIHQSLFHTWMNVLERHIKDFENKGSQIHSLKDFNWLCRPPKYTGGPESTFYSVVNSKMRIINQSEITSIEPQRFEPRIARVLSIYKVENKTVCDVNLVDKIKFCEWQAIRMEDNSGLKPGDMVRVKVLLMPGHTTHAPIQRIIRLRTMVLSSIINRIKSEDIENKRDVDFWNRRKSLVQKSRESTGINICLKE